jgi:hypothetical protein
MAAVFLALLYNSPAGLVLYWTSNNIYNLVKNVIQSMWKINERKTSSKIIRDNALNDNKTFVLALLALALLIGLVIPSSVISSSVEEFSHSVSGEIVSPLRFVIHTMLQAGGFLLWGVSLFFLFQSKARRMLTVVAVSLLIMSVMDTFVYWKDYGFLTEKLVLSNYCRSGPSIQNSSLALIIALSAVAYFFMRIKQKQIIISFLFIAVVSFAAYGMTHIAKINSSFVYVKKNMTIKDDIENSVDIFEKVFTFSRNGDNVIILMLDRAQSQHIPYIFEEKPELLKSFNGFIYYPNMVSFGGHTNVAAPALFGGYHYTPAEIQKRDDGQSLKDKYNEGLQVLPKIMVQNGFDVVVANLPFTDESDEFIGRIFGDLKNIKTVNIIKKYIELYYRGRLPIESDVKTEDYDPVVKRNLFQFALFKCSPYAMRTKVYNNGNYMNIDSRTRSSSGNYTKEMLGNYLSLLFYPQMTQIVDDDKNHCAIMVNYLVHAPSFLQYPDYELVPVVTNRGNGIFANDPQYHVAALSLILISKWLDYLKENGVWDNARIIIMSDHGNADFINPIPANITLPGGSKLQDYNPVLLVKDFGAVKEFSVDSAFMTNADVPTIAMKDIAENPVNPFNQMPLYTDKAYGVLVPTIYWRSWSRHGEYTYAIKDNEWLRVKENVFKKENWSKHTFEK